MPILIGLMFSCTSNSNKANNYSSDPLISHIDSSVNPGDDFFLFANGRWFKENPIPASEGYNGLWLMISDTINAQIRKICESSALLKKEKKGSNKQKISDFFLSGMDSISLNRKGISDITNELKKIDSISNMQDLILSVEHIMSIAGQPMFNFYIDQDIKLSNRYAINLMQGGLNLPDRSYYFDTDVKAVDIRKKYVAFIQQAFIRMGYSETNAANISKKQMQLETELASNSRKLEDVRDPAKNYNKLPFAELIKLAPNIDWKLFFNKCGLQKTDTIIVGQPEFFKALNQIVKSKPLSTWKNYLKLSFFISMSDYLDDKTYQLIFDFYAKTLWGVIEPKPRWKRVVEQTNSSLGELIGEVYVKEYLPEGTKEKLLEIGNAIKDVYAERIKNLDWMSDTTKQKALDKLNKLIMKVGYPDRWKDMSSVIIDRTSYAKNVMNATNWSFRYNVTKYGKPVDRKEWTMTPQTYNAYYAYANNDLVMPACNIIIPGFEYKMADDALLYSIIGATFGHEITHGFDDQGSKFDDKGNLHNWWIKSDSIKFFNKTKMIVEQFNNYIAVDSLHINGNQTQGENIADLAGIMMGYEAFKKTKQYKNHIIISGLNPDQRFFLGYALGWMTNERVELIATQIRSDVHSPSKFRVIGPLSNMPEFYTTFNIKPGSNFWRSENQRIKIW